MCHAVDLFDQQTSLGGVAKIELYHILLFSADVGSLRCRVDHMAAVTCQFLNDISALLQSCDRKAAVCRGLIGADDCAARARGAREVLHLKDCALYRFSGDRIVFPDHQRRQRNVLEGQGLAGAGLNIDLLHGFLDGVACRRLQLSYFVPAITQTGELELSIFIGIEGAEVIDFTAAGVVAGIGNLKLCAF